MRNFRSPSRKGDVIKAGLIGAKLSPELDEELSRLIAAHGIGVLLARMVSSTPTTLQRLAYGGSIQAHALVPIAERLAELRSTRKAALP